MRHLLVLFALSSLLGCGSSSGATDAGGAQDVGGAVVGGSCAMTSTFVCVDYESTGTTLAGYMTACASSGTWSTSPCTHTGAIGGCHYSASSGSGPGTVWSYPGGPYADAAAARTGCESGTPPGTFVAP